MTTPAAPSKRAASIALASLVALVLSAPNGAAATLNGFVTQVNSPADFYVGSLHVVLNGKTQCETQGLRSEIQLKRRGFFHQYFLLQTRPIPKSEVAVPCNALSLRVGSRVQVTGDRGPQDDPIAAAHLIVCKVDIQRKFSTSWKPVEWSGGALLEEEPQLSRTAKGWTGTLWLDGYLMRIAPDTQLFPWIGSFLSWRADHLYDSSIVTSPPPASAFPASLFQPNTWATYRGSRRADGTILLDRIGLSPNQPYAGCEKISTSLTPIIHAPNYASDAPGSAVFPEGGLVHSKVLTILPERNLQDYVSRLGASLIPRYQEAMPETIATKVHFRFYVVQSRWATFDDLVSNVYSLPYMARPNWDDAVLALPNGMIFVPTSTLTGVGSNAQLATILSSAIASVLQGQSCTAWHETQESGAGCFCPIANGMSWAAFAYGFVLWRDEQALRIGIRQMYLAGYDIREAPFAWALAEGKLAANPVTGASGSSAEIPWYTAYAFHYISQFYSDVDYSKLKRGKTEYALFLGELRKADPEAFGPKN
jgi:hypothetical protein